MSSLDTLKSLLVTYDLQTSPPTQDFGFTQARRGPNFAFLSKSPEETIYTIGKEGLLFAAT